MRHRIRLWRVRMLDDDDQDYEVIELYGAADNQETPAK